jgi:hypothetical protein
MFKQWTSTLKNEQFDIEVLRSNAIMVQERIMESKPSLIVSGESHHVGVQVSKDIAPWSNVSIDESLTIDSIVKAFSLNEWLLNFFQQGSDSFCTLGPIIRNLSHEL